MRTRISQLSAALLLALACLAAPAQAVQLDMPSATSTVDTTVLDFSEELISSSLEQSEEKLRGMVNSGWGLTVWRSPGAMLVPVLMLERGNGDFARLFMEDFPLLGEQQMTGPADGERRVRLGAPVEFDCGEGRYADPTVQGNFRLDNPKVTDTVLGSFVRQVAENPADFSPSEREAALHADELGFDYRLTYQGEGSTVRYFIKRGDGGNLYLVHLAAWDYCSA